MTAATARFEVYRDRRGEWRWRLRSRNGLIIADSAEGYASRRNARRAVATVVDTITDPWRLVEMPPAPVAIAGSRAP